LAVSGPSIYSISSKADVQCSSWNHHPTIGWGMSALPPEPDIGLN